MLSFSSSLFLDSHVLLLRAVFCLAAPWSFCPWLSCVNLELSFSQAFLLLYVLFPLLVLLIVYRYLCSFTLVALFVHLVSVWLRERVCHERHGPLQLFASSLVFLYQGLPFFVDKHFVLQVLQLVSSDMLLQLLRLDLLLKGYDSDNFIVEDFQQRLYIHIELQVLVLFPFTEYELCYHPNPWQPPFQD